MKNFFKRKLFNRLKKIFLAGLIFTSLNVNVEAANKPEVIWTPDIYTMNIAGDSDSVKARRNYSLLSSDLISKQIKEKNRRAIIEAIDNKLHSQISQLPFQLKTVNNSLNVEDENKDESFQNKVSIVPLIVMDAAMPASYTALQNKYYKYLFVASIDIALCSDEDGALNIIGIIPMHFYRSVSADHEFTVEELSNQYTKMVVETINKDLDFTKYEKSFQAMFDKDGNLSPKYYQAVNLNACRVEDVTYSQSVENIFTDKRTGRKNNLMKRVFANIFSSEYANKTGNIVYPSKFKDDNSTWQSSAVKGMYSCQLSSTHSGQKEIRMPEDVPNKITLNARGIASQEVQTKETSEINGFKIYKVWFQRIVNGVMQSEASPHVVEKYLKHTGGGNEINKEPEEIYGGLFLEAALKIADPKYKEKK